MPEFLTIRNLTSSTLTLNLVERYQNRSHTAWETLETVCFCGVTEDHSDTCDESEAVEEQNVNAQIPAFRIKRTDIQITTKKKSETSETETLRLTFSNESEGRHRVYIHTTRFNSEDFVPIGNLVQSFAAVYFPVGFLAIFARHNSESWMKNLPDNTPLGAISIPGTHHSPTCYKALPSVRCQAVSPVQQLENGVRFFDFRVQVDDPNDEESKELTLVHGAFPIALFGSNKFKPFYQELLAFLKRNPSETVILSMKREGHGDAKDANLAQRLYGHYINDEHWVMRNGIPTLGEARGKIVLFRRFNLSATMRGLYGKAGGIDASSWADNTANSKSGDVHIQDFYQVLQTEHIQKKTRYILDHCNRAAANIAPIGPISSRQREDQGALFVNFLAASNFWNPGCWPSKIAEQINPAVTQFLCEQHGIDSNEADTNGRTGVLVCDWVGDHGDWDLVKVIISMNERLLARHANSAKPLFALHANDREDGVYNANEVGNITSARRRRSAPKPGGNRGPGYHSSGSQRQPGSETSDARFK